MTAAPIVRDLAVIMAAPSGVESLWGRVPVGAIVRAHGMPKRRRAPSIAVARGSALYPRAGGEGAS
jgi:hypothetical protein